MSILLSPSQQRELLRLARQAIARGCTHREPPEVDRSKQPKVFQEQLATFVTLQKLGELRGCIGSLQAARPLIDDVVHNAFSSAFRDFRFQPVVEDELGQLKIEISILSPMELMPVKTEQELLEAMKPGKDGIYLQSGQHSATFLPQVWEQLPEPIDFLSQLKIKAELPHSLWPENIKIFKYSCLKIAE